MSLSQIDRLKRFQSFSFQEKQEIIATPSLNLVKEVRNGARVVKRRFSDTSYGKVIWLCGCSVSNRLYCFPCVLFNKSANVWSAHGYVDLVNFWAAVKKHETSASHKESSICLARFGSEQIETSISRALQEEITRHNSIVDNNRAILCRLIDCTRFLATHELAFRGSNEGDSSSNQGNFIDLTSLIARYDPLLDAHFENSDRFRGQSPKIQNDLVLSLASCVQARIRSELKEASFVSIEVDETTDISVSTQCSFVLRYVTHNEVVERFWQFLNVSGATIASELAETVLSVIRSLDISKNLLRKATMALWHFLVLRMVYKSL